MLVERPMQHFSLFRFLASPANALCTSDRDRPNSRAILFGVTPALKAARIAFNFPCGKEIQDGFSISDPMTFFRHRRLFPPSPFFKCRRN